MSERIYKQEGQHPWDNLKVLLKEKIQANTINTHENNPEAYWDRFQQITGKSKDEIKSELRRF